MDAKEEKEHRKEEEETSSTNQIHTSLDARQVVHSDNQPKTKVQSEKKEQTSSTNQILTTSLDEDRRRKKRRETSIRVKQPTTTKSTVRE